MSINPSPLNNEVDNRLFRKELNEVSLLLDYISGQPSKSIGQLEIEVPESIVKKSTTFTAGSVPASTPGVDSNQKKVKLDHFTVAQWVSGLRYPPKPNETAKAADAALLICVKDSLNSIAYPAKGMTIAYTEFFVAKLDNRKNLSVAAEAYPELECRANAFRGRIRKIAFAAVILTGVAAIVLWLVVYGAQLAAKFEEDRKKSIDLWSQIYQEIDKVNRPNLVNANGYATNPDINVQCAHDRLSKEPSNITILCGQWGYAQKTYEQTISDACMFALRGPTAWLFIFFPSKIGKLQQDCKKRPDEPASEIARGRQTTPADGPKTTRALAQQNEQLARQESDQEAGQQARQLKELSVASRHTVCVDPYGMENENYCVAQEDIQSIAIVLSTYTNYILPVVFGVIGAMASLLRDIGDKIADSTLSPRDEVRGTARLPLGFMAGVAVGLFISPTGAATSIASGSGVLTITASGIAFLAGYGADAFFKMLDSLKSIILSLKPVK
ncbi:hypothetical protein [Burkholderia ubonensis]|uniref:hypothetical protein n=1 Tax=Burkholderia ubonensis TaxID=101571 RepID=UPI000A7A4504|nr:hypothetical protein [Burkholderia ubonensis]